MSMGHQWEDDW